MAKTHIHGYHLETDEGQLLWSTNYQLKLKCIHGFSFTDRSTEKIIVCEDLGNGTAEWTFLDSCYSGMNNNLIVNIEKSLNLICIKW